MSAEILVFEVSDRRFGVPSGSVVEVVRAVTLTPPPAASAVAEGLLNLRGRVVPVLDVRRMFGLPSKDLEHTDHLVVVRSEERLVALRVDRATDFAPSPDESLQGAEDVAPNSDLIRATTRVDDRIIYVLDVSRLLTVLRVAAPSSVASGTAAGESPP